MSCALSGTVTNPHTGRRVSWRVVPAIVADDRWAATNGVRCLGTIGNAQHLAGSGQHTPWSPSPWAPGFVHAIDLVISAAQFARVLAQLRTGRWNRIVRYVNFGGAQYRFEDSFRSSRSNPDHHLHISYTGGTHTYTGPSLMQAAMGGTFMALSDAQQRELLDKVRSLHGLGLGDTGSALPRVLRLILGLDPDKPFPTDAQGKVVGVLGIRQVHDVLLREAATDATRDQATLAAIEALAELVRSGGGNVDTAAILARIDEQAQHTRTAVLAELTETLERLAAAGAALAADPQP